MAIPESVRKQEELANKLIAGDKDADQNQPQNQGDAGNEHHKQLPGEPSEETKSKGKDNDPDYWKRRFKAAEGIFKSQAADLRAQVQNALNMVEQLKDENQALKEAIQQQEAKPSETVSTDDVLSVLSDEEREDYGDMVGVIAKIADKLADKKVQAVRQQIEPEIKSVKQSSEESRMRDFYSTVATLVKAEGGNIYEINDDPVFHQWLSKVDRYTGQTRQDLLTIAERNRNPELVAQFFIDFITEESRRANSRRNELDRKRLPENSSIPDDYSGSDKKIWTQQEISEFYQDMALGRYRFRQKEAAQIEQDIFLAGKEGRIR